MSPIPPAQSQPPEPIPPERLAKVNAARERWIRQLVDMSRRNNLLYFRDLRVGTLDLTAAPTRAMLALVKPGGSVPLGDLLPPDGLTQATAALSEIASRARSNFEERGLDTLFVALGLASWTSADGGRNSAAPAFLLPIQATQAPGRRSPWSLRRAGDLKVNDVLVHALRQEHDVALDGDAVLAKVQGDDDGEDFDLSPAFIAISEAAARIPGFTIDPRWVVGNFAFQKMAIVKDLQLLGDALARHDMVAGIAGDARAANAARGDRSSVDPQTFDQLPPNEEFLILDADSSQQQAVAATLRGRNGVISGPPGTGKSQTIANLVAESVARGKRVLFVAEKRAALDVVLDRLSAAGLGHLCLDCHGAELTRRHVAEQLQASIERVRDAPMPDAEGLHTRFLERRTTLNAHVRAMHAPRQPGGLSVYTLYGRILSHTEDTTSSTRLTRSVLAPLDERTIDECAGILRELGSLEHLVLGTSSSPWIGAQIRSVSDLRTATECARRLANERWPPWQASLTALMAECPIKEPAVVADARAIIRTVTAISDTLLQHDIALYQAELETLARQLQPATSTIRSLLAFLFDSTFRRALREVGGYHSTGKLPARAALELVTRAQCELNDWRGIAAVAGTPPLRSVKIEAAATAWQHLDKDLQEFARFFPGMKLDELRLLGLGAWFSRLAADAVTPAELLRLYELEQQLGNRGLAPILAEIRARKPAARHWPELLRSSWLLSCLAEIQMDDPSIPVFRGSLHDQIAEEFRSLDRQRLQVAALRVQREHAKAAVKARNEHPDQSSLVAREANKRSRHLPLRSLFAQASDVLLALRPCWMASPLSVSQLIPGERPLFDLVVFDEASQVLPEDAVTSLLRGHQSVIAGDSRQLPPTTFFAAGGSLDGDEDADDEGGGTEGFQSILDLMSAFLEPAWSLDWHYRSRDEALIAYSNHRIYGGRLITFPGPGRTAAVRLEEVPHVPGVGGQELSAAREVQRVIALIIEHAATRPTETLGVITMGIEHARRIEMALMREREGHPELEPFFAFDRRERFFIKNLERVQGDERDAIILSIGYGKNEAGNVVYRFGPLLQDGGERRLNVAITRARNRMTVVSSFGHADLRPDYPKVGVQLLRGFLEFAASGGKRLDSAVVTDVPLNDFEQSVRDELTRRGLTLVGQVGTSRYRIDLVATHPQKAGRYVMAIECDGASYHSTPTARDRDRLRQQQLEALGWRFHRIWSTDWFLRREEEVQRTLRAFNSAVEHADRIDRDGLSIVPTPTAALEVLPRAERQRTARPSVSPGMEIGDYSHRDLCSLVSWAMSDGRLPTDDEIIAELTTDLGFQRRGSRIVDSLTAAIRSVRRNGGD